MSDFRNHLARMLENPEFQKEYEHGKAEYEVTRALVAARIEQNLTQAGTACGAKRRSSIQYQPN